MRVLGVVLLSIGMAVGTAEAAETFRFTEHSDSNFGPKTVSGQVLVDGARYRLELDPVDEPRKHDVIVSTDGGVHEQAMLVENRWFYDLEPSPLRLSSASYRLLPVGEPRVHDVVVQVEEGEHEVLNGLATRKHVIRIEYGIISEVYGTDVEGVVRSTVELWLADRPSMTLPRGLRPDVYTSFPEIDDQLAAHLEALAGMVVQRRIIATAQIPGEAPNTSTQIRTFEGFRAAKARATDFAIPQGYVHREPSVVGFERVTNPP